MGKRRDESRRNPRLRVAAGAGIAIGASFAAAGTAQADQFTVSNLDASGAGSLRDALDQANADTSPTSADTIVFQSGLTGTINLNQPTATYALDINGPVDIEGPGADQVTISANALSRVFNVDTAPGDAVKIANLKLIQGSAKYNSCCSYDGGDIRSSGAALTIANSVIRTGAADDGGGIYSEGASLTLQNSTVAGNLATFSGGGIFSSNYTYTPDSTASSGDATELGATTITGSTINNNAAGKYDNPANTPVVLNRASTDAPSGTPSDTRAYGGGASLEGAVTIDNSTFSGNTTTGNGGGLYLNSYVSQRVPPYPSSTADIRSTTISGNSASAGGGIYSYVDDGVVPETPARTDAAAPSPALSNSIVAGNEADSAALGPDLNGGPFDASFTLIQRTTGATVNETTANSNLTGVDPLLGALTDNGGPTRTMALPLDSPAIDAGKTPSGETTDQRGAVRPADVFAVTNRSDGADMGAYEHAAVAGPPPPPPPPPPGQAGTCDGETATITGTPNRDIIQGTPGRDVIVGGAGNDAIRSFGGNDLICSGSGLDQVTGGTGDDVIFGQGDNDRLYGQAGDDEITDSPGDDLLSGGTGNDTLKGGNGQDRVLGADGNDKLYGQGSDDVVLGAKGDDLLRGGPGNDRLSGGRGNNDVQQ